MCFGSGLKVLGRHRKRTTRFVLEFPLFSLLHILRRVVIIHFRQRSSLTLCTVIELSLWCFERSIDQYHVAWEM